MIDSTSYLSTAVRAFLSFTVVVTALGGCTATTPHRDIGLKMPVPREIGADERGELAKLVLARTGVKLGPDAEFRAAGPFRFAGNADFLYMDRTDTGSVALENRRYGDAGHSLDERFLDKQSVLRRTEDALKKLALRADGRLFSGFQDEFVGAVRPKTIAPGFDVRKASKLVARTVTFRRELEGIPVFGSELNIGLMPDGSLGRLRLHWPRVAPESLRKAKALEGMVASKKWRVPEFLRGKEFNILQVEAGIKHTGFAIPGYKEAAVVRVLVRKSAGNGDLQTSSTRYVYLDGAGRELRFTAFPELPSTPAKAKVENRATGDR